MFNELVPADRCLAGRCVDCDAQSITHKEAFLLRHARQENAAPYGHPGGYPLEEGGRASKP
eukprot:scaffold9550_cov111-Isochrysis_galbana.AAC.1